MDSDAIVASSSCDRSRAGDCANWGFLVMEGLGSEGTYGSTALLFGAADFEIGKARYARVFLEFCVGFVMR